ncbi:MAG: helicase-related protein [Gemmatimonadales bacterium]
MLASLRVFHGALLADAVGLGKTYEALAVATAYEGTLAVVPASLRAQWERTSENVGVEVRLLTLEALSRGTNLPEVPLIIVDEAHRLRNPKTRRYDVLARAINKSHLLLLTATPVVNSGADLVNLLRLFTADHSFSLLGLPSLEQALSRRAYRETAYATSSAVIARSTKCVEGLQIDLPRLRDRSIIRPSPIATELLSPLLQKVDRLQFPSVNDSHESALLRIHLLYRLASSSAAFRSTVQKHLVYVERAIAASQRGEILSRSTARLIFRSDHEFQLQLGDVADRCEHSPLDHHCLEREHQRLRRLLDLVDRTHGDAPKQTALRRILTVRTGRKTLVFTTTLATAIDLARMLRWCGVAVVASGRGWIASGPISPDEALNLFAPHGRKALQPPRAVQVSTLIATDLASEGLDLQDADAVVHYDLPWTPLRLEQRVGRIARLGSSHRVAEVQWFAPPRSIENRLHIESRIDSKTQCQLGLSVASTSRVGQARIVNQSLQRRELLGRAAAKYAHPIPCHAVVHAPLCAAVAVHWLSGDDIVPELIVLAGAPIELVYDYAIADAVVTQLINSKSSKHHPPRLLLDAVTRLVRSRLAAAARGPTNQANRRLARTIVQRASLAGWHRDTRTLNLLDTMLDRVRSGLSIGAERKLTQLLNNEISWTCMSSWLDEQPTIMASPARLQVVGAIFGDGTEESVQLPR